MTKIAPSLMLFWFVLLNQIESTAQPNLFKLLKEIKVTPSGNYQNADFVRIGYVPGRDRFIVTFNTMVSDSGWCSESFDRFYGLYRVYAYKEYTADMMETGKTGIVSCHGTNDTGAFFNGNDFYLASVEIRNNVEGWNLAKFDAMTWMSSVEYFYPLSNSSWLGGDPTVALVNGQIDISSVYDGGTHHHFFTTDLQFVSERILSDIPHSGFSSMITQGGITNFLTSRPGTGGAPWAVIVMQYDPNWNYLGVKTLKEHAATPQGLAFDGIRYYVSYTERTDAIPFSENIHLAAFDTNWNIVEDIALTNYTLQEKTSSIHPWLVLRDNRLYVSYSQNAPAGGIPETLQAYVKVFEITEPATLVESTPRDQPRTFFLRQNYPNPFNPTTTISYDLLTNSPVTLTIYDVFGRQIGILVNKRETAGFHSVRFDASSLPSGVYFYRLQAGMYHDTNKLLLLK